MGDDQSGEGFCYSVVESLSGGVADPEDKFKV